MNAHPCSFWQAFVGNCFVQTRTMTVGAIHTFGQSKQTIDMMMNISILLQILFEQQQLHILSVPAVSKVSRYKGKIVVKQCSTKLDKSQVCAYCKALFVLVFIGNVNQEGYYGRVPLHQLHHEVEAQMHTLTDQALMPRSTAADQSVQRLHHHLTLSFVPLETSNMPGQHKNTTQASDAQPHRSGLPHSC